MFYLFKIFLLGLLFFISCSSTIKKDYMGKKLTKLQHEVTQN